MATKKSTKTAKKAETKKPGTTVAKKEAGGKVASKGLMDALVQDQGAGHEAMTSQDMALPFMYLLQDLSPQVKKRNEEYVEGAEPGMFFENIGRTLWEDGESGVLVVPCHFNSKVIEWVKRVHGGGFVAIHPDKEAALMECADPEKNDLVDTHQHFVLAQRPDGTWVPCLFPMTSTKMKASRRWNAAIAQQSRTYEGAGKINLPRFGCVWRIRSAEVSNEKGDFHTVTTPELVEDVINREDAESLYKSARAFYALCSAGEAKVDWTKYEAAKEEEEEEAEDGGPSF